MTDRKNESDKKLDLIAAEIGSQSIDAESEQRITDRVWTRISAVRHGHAPLRSCDDFQREIPAFVAGSLPEARALLVGDHTRGCVACRRALMQERGELREAGPTRMAGNRLRNTRIFLRAAAAILIVLAGFAGVHLGGNLLADRSLTATVASVDGSLQLVSSDGSASLDEGREIRSRQVIRTTKNSGALIRLDDGSLVEMNQRSEIELRASRRGTTIDLQRGNIIVHAAEQHDGRLFVDTSDCEVAVKGTIFSVNHGLKGSRVSVIEGEVEVREGAASALLRPGDQITTSDRLRTVPLEDEIAWSRDAEKHRQLIREINSLRRVVAAAVDQAPPRTSTFLLDLCPPDTFVYAAMPNITEDLDDARTAFDERLAASPVLREWWQTQVVDPGVEAEIDEILDRLQPIGEAIGAEAVVAVSEEILDGQGMPLFMAELDDAQSFLAELEILAQRANEEAGGTEEVVIVSDPRTAAPTEAQILLWVEDNLFAATSEIEALRALAARKDDPASRDFMGTRLHTRLAEVYAGGVSWLMGADIAVAIDQAMAQMPEDETEAFASIGVLDITTLIVERHRDGDWYATNAALLFSSQRSGIMAWLESPAPMGSLEFVSPNAYIAASGVTRDPVLMFDDLLAIVAEQDENGWAEFQAFQERIGVDLREDLAATLGGEAAFALDGPMLPVPSWKLIVEVYDPETLFHTIRNVVAEINLELAAHDQPPVLFQEVEAGGRTYYTLEREGLEGSAVMTTFDGYLVVGPNFGVIQHAIDQRTSGVNLTNSEAFLALLPDNGYTDCSALVYRDLDALVNAVPAEFLEQFEVASALSDELATGLVCVFGADDRITATATGGSLVGLGSALGMATALNSGADIEKAIERMEEIENANDQEAVSSRG